jgi:hypothetical protein
MFKKIFSILTIALMFVITISKAQTAMQINGNDCNGTSHDLFADLNAGKASVVFFFMPNCSTCPPVAQKIQTMVNNILVSHPNMVTAYAMPFNNTTTCAYTSSWITNNSLSLYSPYDSGAVQVANYGGFGMPTVVLLGGINHRVMFSTLSFATSDTTIMRDSILALFTPLSINDIPSNINSIDVYPNPSANIVNISIDLKEQTNLQIDVMDITGKIVASISNDKNQQGKVTKHFNTDALVSGLYSIRINANGKIANRKLNVIH